MIDAFTFSQNDFRAIVSLIYDETGIVLAQHKRDMVYSRLSRRLRKLNIKSFSDYIAYVSGAGKKDELRHLVNAITTNLTSFFREAHHFEHLRNDLLLPLIERAPTNKKLRFWSAGCSSGAEPYSIAMVLAECIDKHSGWDAKILATDIDSNMIAHGKKGIYKAEDMKAIPKPYQRYIALKGGQLQMKPILQKLITFKHLNLLESWPMKGPFDVIFCRNVVIYFDKATQQRLFARLRTLISPHGVLYIGHSESLSNVTEAFKLEGKTIYRPC